MPTLIINSFLILWHKLRRNQQNSLFIGRRHSFNQTRTCFGLTGTLTKISEPLNEKCTYTQLILHTPIKQLYLQWRAGRSEGRIPVGARFSATVQTGPGAHPASCTMGTGTFPGVKRPGRGVDHPPTSKCRGHERVGLYLYSPSGPQWPVTGRTFTLTFYIVAEYRTWTGNYSF